MKPPPDVRAARAWLFCPGDRPDRFDKAVASGADVVVLDMEDAVAPEAKSEARRCVVDWLAAGPAAAVRVNAMGTPEHAEDVQALVDLPGLTGVVVPMADDPDGLSAISRRVGVPVVALLETATGVLRAREIASADGVERLALGAIDLCLDIDAVEDDTTLLFARSSLVFASRAAGVAPPVDGVTLDVSGGEAAGEDARRARRLGFGGKLCVHPRQVDSVIAAFRPADDEIDWARRVLAVERVDGSAVRVDGLMVDRPVIERAHRILAWVGR